jgi:hypothetical protein
MYNSVNLTAAAMATGGLLSGWDKIAAFVTY